MILYVPCLSCFEAFEYFRSIEAFEYFRWHNVAAFPEIHKECQRALFMHWIQPFGWSTPLEQTSLYLQVSNQCDRGKQITSLYLQMSQTDRQTDPKKPIF